MVVLRDKPIGPGETEYVQLVLERPLATAAGDRFVVRDTSSSRTVGGGVLIDLRAPERRRRTPERRAEIEALARSDPSDALASALAGPGGWLDIDAFCRDRALGPAAAAHLKSELALVVLQAGAKHLAALPGTWEALRSHVGGTLDAFHAERPDLPGVGLEQLRNARKPALAAPLFLAALRKLAEAGGGARPARGSAAQSRVGSQPREADLGLIGPASPASPTGRRGCASPRRWASGYSCAA